MAIILTKPVRKYVDIALGFARHPITNALALKTNVEAIKQSVRNILLTRRGEKLFDPNYGSPVYEYLFENMSSILTTVIETEVRNAIETYEPRVRVKSVNVEYDQQHQLLVDVNATIIATQEPFQLGVLFERLR